MPTNKNDLDNGIVYTYTVYEVTYKRHSDLYDRNDFRINVLVKTGDLRSISSVIKEFYGDVEIMNIRNLGFALISMATDDV